MILSEKSHQNLSDYIQFLFKNIFKFNKKKWIISSEKIRKSGNYMYGYARSFFGKGFQSNPLYWYIYHLTEYLHIYVVYQF